MGQYAADTTVAADRSRSEIEATLGRYGASSFMYGWSGMQAIIGFVAHDRQIKFVLEMPDRNSKEFTHTPSRGTRRSDAQAEAAWEQATRQRWRALALVVKAKLEAVESGISTFESEFLAWTVLPDGSTAGQWIEPQIQEAYATGKMPEMLPALGVGDGSQP